jgi:hypothetical protein
MGSVCVYLTIPESLNNIAAVLYICYVDVMPDAVWQSSGATTEVPLYYPWC